MLKNKLLFIIAAFAPVFFAKAQVIYNPEYIFSYFTDSERSLLQKIPNKDLLVRDSIQFKDSKGNFPGVLFLGLYESNGNLASYCSAALISPKLAVTAKHCLRLENIHELAVVNSGKSASSSKVSRISSGCTPEGWCAVPGSLHIPLALESFKNTDFASEDIVLLHLETDLVVESKDYFKIYDHSVDLASISMRLAGYPDFATYAGYPQYVSAPVCDYVTSLNRTIISNCIPSGGVSGGPLFFTHQGSNYLVGILSSHIGVMNLITNETFAGSRYAPVFDQEFIRDALKSSAVQSSD